MSTRFSTAARVALGYTPEKFDHCYNDAFTPERLSNMFDRNNEFVSKYREILDILYSNNDGVYPDFAGYLNRPNTPQLVKDFVSNVLMTELPSIPSAPDDNTAFSSIIPRDATISQYRDQIDNLVQYFKDNPLNATSDQGQPSDSSSKSY